MKSGRVVLIGLALLLFGYLFLHSNAYGVWTRGLGYMNNSPDKYVLSYHEIPGEYSLEIDLNDLESNVGKRIWQDGEQYIEVYLVDETDGRYRIFFRSHGVYEMQKGNLISGTKHIKYDNNTCIDDFARLLGRLINVYKSILGISGAVFTMCAMC